MNKLILGLGICSLLAGCSNFKEGISYLALGDSYTIGESVETTGNFPYQLADSISRDGKEYISPVIIARTGWRTDELIEAVESANLKKEYELVTLLIGVNNEFQGKSIEEYERDFIVLCKKSVELAANRKERVYVLSIPDYGYTSFGESNLERISTRIDQFNAVNKRITDSLELNYIEITGISRKGLKQTDLVAEDGLHPSEKMYGLWVEEILGKMKIKTQD